MINNRSTYASSPVPRYTSYPTAPHFGPEVDGSIYEGWLRDLPSDMDLSLYFHVPFCRAMCSYCGCHTKAVLKDAPIRDYSETLLREIDLTAAALGGGHVTHIHWGGGTPSLVPGDLLRRIARELEGLFSYDAAIEHAMELDPRTVDDAMAETLAACGINRASLGVQDVDPKVQEAIGRIQPLSVVASATEHLRKAGVSSVNMDLMFGLPQQGVDEVLRSVDAVSAFGAERVALFGYAHVPWFKSHQRLIKEDDLPDTLERLDQAEAARERLQQNGYVAIGFDHFALPSDSMAIAEKAGTLKRNFQGYTTDTAPALIGMGASSIGKLPQGFVQNAPDTGGWKRAIEDGRFATVRGKALSDDDRLRSDIIEQLMTQFETHPAALARHYGFEGGLFDATLAGLAELESDGLCAVDGEGRIRIPEEARAFVRVVAARFDAYLETASARHSVAV